jgi:hypothetical protein
LLVILAGGVFGVVEGMPTRTSHFNSRSGPVPAMVSAFGGTVAQIATRVWNVCV